MHQDDMLRENTYVSLTVHRSGHMTGNKELVVACGYTISGLYGYFICNEEQHRDPEHGTILHKYTDQRAFVPKRDETSYADALQLIKSIVA